MSKQIILVVEDDHDTRVNLRQTLEEFGYTVVSATHGQDAFDALKKMKKCDLVLLDWMLPLASGADFVKMKNADPSLASIPLVVMSAHKKNVQGPGILVFLKKPFSAEDLLKTVRMVIKKI